jgi:hypothetical protein
LQRLAAVEASLRCAPEPRPGDSLQVVERWLAASTDRLGMTGAAELGLVALAQLQVQLVMIGGPLARTDDHELRPHRERLELVRGLQGQVCDALNVARRRLLERSLAFEAIAEAGIRVAADAKLLSTPGDRPRHEWLADMATRMADHPHSAAHLARLGLSVEQAELLDVLDRVFVRVFGV